MISRGLRLIDNIRVKYKLFILYIVVILVPVVLVMLYLNYGLREVVLNNTLNETNANMDKMEMQLNSIFDRATEISDLIYVNKDMEKILDRDYESNLEIYQAYNEYPVFDQYLKYYNEVENIRFYMTNDMITNSHFIYADHTIKQKDWYQHAIKKKGKISWIYTEDIWTGENYLALSRAIYDSNNRLLGVLHIYISPDRLNEVARNEVYDAYISLDNEIIVHHNSKDNIGKEITFLEKSREAKANYIKDITYMDEEVKIYVRSFQPEKSLENSMQVSAIIPVEKVMRDANEVLLKGFTIIISCIVISIMLLYLFIRSFDRRIRILKGAMHKVSNGNFDITENIAGRDEIGEVYRELNITINSIQDLINKVYIHKINEETYKRKQKESEFKMLSSQINPHFLYNTLEMIRMKALINKDMEVATIVKLLSKVMRSSLETTDQPILLNTELQLIETYLQIQKLRFGDKIDYSIHIEKNIDTEKCYVFPLLLQPIIENAVIHGLERKVGNGNIDISIERRANNLSISIKDNGVGIDQHKLRDLNDKLLKKDSDQGINHIGLFNVHQRIQLHYGFEYGIMIISHLNKGTEIILTLPMERGEDVGYA